MNGIQLSFLKGQEKGCEWCEHYSPLREPRERADGAVIYGYCFASGTRNYSGNEGKGYAVFLPEGGTCPKFKKKERKG